MNQDWLTIEETEHGKVLTECSREATGEIIIPDGVTKIGGNAFFLHSTLTSIHIPDSVTEIGESAFSVCSALTSIHIPDSVMKIGRTAFDHRGALTSIDVAKGNPCFDSRDNCNAIIDTRTNILIRGCQSTVIPDSVTKIGDWAFNCCSALTSIHIPDSVREIGLEVFSECTALKTISIKDKQLLVGAGVPEGVEII